MKDPAQCVMDLLVTAQIGDLMTTTPALYAPWRVCAGHPPLSPDTVVVCNVFSGRSPMPHLLLNQPSVQVMVRGAKNGYQDAYTKMKDAVKALLGMETTTVQGDVYRSCNMTGDIAYIGQDDATRPMFTANFWFIVLPAAESGDNRVAIQ